MLVARYDIEILSGHVSIVKVQRHLLACLAIALFLLNDISDNIHSRVELRLESLPVAKIWVRAIQLLMSAFNHILLFLVLNASFAYL